MPVAFPQRRVAELDGLRGAAVLFVLIHHYVLREGATAPGSAASFLQRFASLGWTGVDLFFVLSGFLIGGILMDARLSPSYFKTFYVRRFFRIIPIYYLWIVCYIGLVAFARPFLSSLSPLGRAASADFSVYAHFAFLQNVGIVHLKGLAGVWLNPAWSLAVEEQFYLVAPLVIRLVSPRRLLLFLVAVIACVPLLRLALLQLVRAEPVLVFGLMPSRADALALGMVAALLWRSDSARAWLSANSWILYCFLALLFLGVAARWSWVSMPLTFGMQSVGYTWMALLYVVILLLALAELKGPVAKLMRLRWLREIGCVSYCMYIIHTAVNGGCHAVLLHAKPRISNWQGAAVTICAAVLTYGIAKLSWIFVERPLLRLGHTFRY